MGTSKSVTNSAEAIKARKRKWWKKNKDRMRSESRAKPENRYNALKLRCKREKRKFKMTLKTYLDKLKQGCYYCGASLMEEIGGSMDRRNNLNRNYVARNLVPCCSDCNKIKSDRLSEKEMVVAMKAVNKYRRSK